MSLKYEVNTKTLVCDNASELVEFLRLTRQVEKKQAKKSKTELNKTEYVNIDWTAVAKKYLDQGEGNKAKFLRDNFGEVHSGLYNKLNRAVIKLKKNKQKIKSSDSYSKNRARLSRINELAQDLKLRYPNMSYVDRLRAANKLYDSEY